MNKGIVFDYDHRPLVENTGSVLDYIAAMVRQVEKRAAADILGRKFQFVFKMSPSLWEDISVLYACPDPGGFASPLWAEEIWEKQAELKAKQSIFVDGVEYPVVLDEDCDGDIYLMPERPDELLLPHYLMAILWNVGDKMATTKGEPNNREWWYCELCKKQGDVETESGEGAWAVLQKIFRDHRRVSPDCDGGGGDIRLMSKVTGIVGPYIGGCEMVEVANVVLISGSAIKRIRAEIFRLAKRAPDLDTMHWYMWLDDCFENDEFHKENFSLLQWRASALVDRHEPVGWLLNMITPVLVEAGCIKVEDK